jgi:hypothetical protein
MAHTIAASLGGPAAGRSEPIPELAALSPARIERHQPLREANVIG